MIYKCAQYVEKLPNGHQHKMMMNKIDTIYSNRQITYSVPSDHYFVFGDNRYAAMDSRFIGPIHKGRIKARITRCF